MPGRGGWKTALKYTVGIAVLAVSVAAAWFLPGLYADWQDARLEGRPVLSHRDSITFLDTASLDSAGRLQILEEQSGIFQWDTAFYNRGVEISDVSSEKMLERCRDIMGKWCDAGLFPERCLSCISQEALFLFEPVSVYLDNTALPVCLLHFYEVDGCSATIVADVNVDLIYYAAVCGPGMLDAAASAMGFDSFGTMAEYEKEILEEKGIDPEKALDMLEEETVWGIGQECTERVTPEDPSKCDFASVCGAQGAKPDLAGDLGLSLDAQLQFERFTGHAWRRPAVMYNYEYIETYAFGFAVMYGTWKWQDFVRSIAESYGCGETVLEEDSDWTIGWYGLGIMYACGDYEMRSEIGYPAWPAAEAYQEPFDADDGIAAAAGGYGKTGTGEVSEADAEEIFMENSE